MTRLHLVQVHLPLQLVPGSAPGLGSFDLFFSQLDNVAGLIPKIRPIPRMLGRSLCFRIAVLRIKHSACVAILAPILLASAAIVPVFDDMFTSTTSTHVVFPYHSFSLSLIT